MISDQAEKKNVTIIFENSPSQSMMMRPWINSSAQLSQHQSMVSLVFCFCLFVCLTNYSVSGSTECNYCICLSSFQTAYVICKFWFPSRCLSRHQGWKGWGCIRWVDGAGGLIIHGCNQLVWNGLLFCCCFCVCGGDPLSPTFPLHATCSDRRKQHLYLGVLDEKRLD